MKHKTWIITLLAIAAFSVGCNKEQTTSQKLGEVKEDTKAVTQDMKDYTFAQKEEFVKSMETHMQSINKDLDKLSAKLEDAGDEVKADAKPKLQALRDQLAGLNKHLDNVRGSTESTWDNVKATSQDAFDSLKEGFQTSRQWLSDKIAP